MEQEEEKDRPKEKANPSAFIYLRSIYIACLRSIPIVSVRFCDDVHETDPILFVVKKREEAPQTPDETIF
jgi:hypothetical protein